LNPIIKFTTLFGLLAVEIANGAKGSELKYVGIVLLLVGCGFVLRSFYGMKISKGTLKKKAH
jgi:K(+)-stimulated pyrophosphate-energized sodium pump